MTNQDEDFVFVRWSDATFRINRLPDGLYRCDFQRGADERHITGRYAPDLIERASLEVGFPDGTGAAIIFAIMAKMRERLFN